jgi:hypothetical protein
MPNDTRIAFPSKMPILGANLFTRRKIVICMAYAIMNAIGIERTKPNKGCSEVRSCSWNVIKHARTTNSPCAIFRIRATPYWVLRPIDMMA